MRGANKQTIFEDEEDAEKFLQTLEDYKEKSGYKIFGYCLMGNHIHLLIKEEKYELGIVLRRIGERVMFIGITGSMIELGTCSKIDIKVN